MKIETFIDALEEDIKLGKKPFMENMKHIGVHDLTFCEWIDTFSAWMEWHKGDCEMNHVQYIDDEQ